MLREGDSGALHKGIASYWCETLRHIQFFSGISREKAAEFFRISVNMVEAIRGLSPCDLTMAALRLSQMPVCRVPPFSERGERMVLEILRDADVTKLTPEQALAEIAHGMQQPDD